VRSCLVLQCSHLPYWPDHQRRLANWLDACVLHKRTTFLFWRAFQPAELCRNGATLSLACCHMEPWHLLHSALTRPSSGNAWHLKSRHPFFTRCSTTHQSFDDNNRSAVECRKVGVHYETRYFHPQPTLLERHCQEQRQIAQPECGRRHLGPVRNKLAKIFTGVLYEFSIVRKLTEGTIGRTPGDWFPWTKFLAAPLTASTASAPVSDVPLLLAQMSMASSAVCECGAEEHLCCLPMSNPSTPHELHGLIWMMTMNWLLNTCPET